MCRSARAHQAELEQRRVLQQEPHHNRLLEAGRQHPARPTEWCCAAAEVSVLHVRCLLVIDARSGEPALNRVQTRATSLVQPATVFVRAVSEVRARLGYSTRLGYN